MSASFLIGLPPINEVLPATPHLSQKSQGTLSGRPSTIFSLNDSMLSVPLSLGAEVSSLQVVLLCDWASSPGSTNFLLCDLKRFVSYSICVSFSSSCKKGEIIPNLQWCCENWIRNNLGSVPHMMWAHSSHSATKLLSLRVCGGRGCCPSVGLSRQGLPPLSWVSESIKQR